MEHSFDMYENAPITRRNTPHNRCAEANYFTIMLNCQFTAEPANTRLEGQTFFGMLPWDGALFRQYHSRCLKSAAEHWMKPSA